MMPPADRLVGVEVAGLIAVEDAQAQAPAVARALVHGGAAGLAVIAATGQQAAAQGQATEGQAVAEEAAAGEGRVGRHGVDL